MVGALVVSRLTKWVERLARRRLLDALVEGLLTAVLSVTCVVPVAFAMSLIAWACRSNFWETRLTPFLMPSVVPERAKTGMLVCWSARS